MKQWRRIARTWLPLFLVTGCATLSNEREQHITIRSNVEGADVYLAGVRVGTTPLTTELPRMKNPEISLRKEGYKTVRTNLESGISNSFWWNVPLSLVAVGFTGMTVDLTQGTAFEYSKSEYLIEMQKEGDSLFEYERHREEFLHQLYSLAKRARIEESQARHEQ